MGVHEAVEHVMDMPLVKKLHDNYTAVVDLVTRYNTTPNVGLKPTVYFPIARTVVPSISAHQAQQVHLLFCITAL